MFHGAITTNGKDVLEDGDINKKLKGKMNSEDVEKAYQFRKLAEQPDHIGKMLQTARKLEGSIRNTGIISSKISKQNSSSSSSSA